MFPICIYLLNNDKWRACDLHRVAFGHKETNKTYAELRKKLGQKGLAKLSPLALPMNTGTTTTASCFQLKCSHSHNSGIQIPLNDPKNLSKKIRKKHKPVKKIILANLRALQIPC